MDELIRKLSVLARARLGRLSPVRHRSGRAQPNLGSNVDRDIEQFRRHLNEAFLHEDALKAEIRRLRDEAAAQDRAADDALKQGRGDVARLAVEAMQRAERRMRMLESDLAEHQRAAQDLLRRVNLLETVVSESRRERDGQASEPAEAKLHDAPALDAVLKEAQETVERMAEVLKPPMTSTADPNAESSVEEDLERRIARLSRR